MKRWLLVLHRWTGLTLGLVLMLSGLTGLVLVVSDPVVKALDRPLREIAEPARVRDEALDRMQGALRKEFPKAPVVVRLPANDRRTIEARMRGEWKGTVYFHPVTGEEVGRKADAGDVRAKIFDLHSMLLSGDTGKAILLAAAIGFLVLMTAGYVLWWPRTLKEGLAIKWRGKLRRLLLDLHRVGGATLALFLLVQVATGAWMAWRPIGTGVNALAGSKVQEPPAFTPEAGVKQAALSRIVHAADDALPGGRVSYVPLDPTPGKPMRVRKRLEDEVHPNGLSVVWVDPQKAVAIRATRWHEADVAARWTEYLYPLHSAHLGGVLHEILAGLLGAVLFTMGVTGIAVWWSRGRPIK